MQQMYKKNAQKNPLQAGFFMGGAQVRLACVVGIKGERLNVSKDQAALTTA